MKPFAVLIKDNEGATFKTYESYEEAWNAANNAACMSCCEVTVFDYDEASDEYLEFFTI